MVNGVEDAPDVGAVPFAAGVASAVRAEDDVFGHGDPEVSDTVGRIG